MATMAIRNQAEEIYQQWVNGNVPSKAECMRMMFRLGMTATEVFHAMHGRANRGECGNAYTHFQGREYAYETRARQARATRNTRVNEVTEVAQGSVSPVDIYNAYTFGIEFEIGAKCGKYASSDDFIIALIRTAERMGIRMQTESLSHSAPDGYWKIVSDGSLSSDNTCEYMCEVVSPILKGVDGWMQLEKMCMVFDLVGARVNNSCGTHVHIGAGACTWENIRNVAMSYNNAWEAMSGVLPSMRRNTRWARRYTEEAINDMQNCATFADTLQAGHVFADARNSGLNNGHYANSRYHAVNLVSYKQRKTIEFRAHQGTTNYHKISMWLRACMELVEWSKENRLITQASHVSDLPWLSQDTKQNMMMRELRYAM